jgi:HEPN domain-containing protein
MASSCEEWLRQADYDMETAEFMLDGGRTFYAAFMCHLAVEKGLKGLYQAKLGHVPPRTHNLVYLLKKAGLRPAAEMDEFLVSLNEVQVATRYPEDLGVVGEQFPEPRVRAILERGREVLTWIRAQR